MARSPFQVLVFPYRKGGESDIEYAILRSSDDGHLHTVAGGGEGNETPLEAARPDTLEETGISEDSTFLELHTVFPVPMRIYRESYIWGDDLYMILSYCFGILVEKGQITLFNEKLEHK